MLAWVGGVALLLLSARDDVLEARDDLRDIRDDADEDTLLDPSTVAHLAAIEATLRDAGRKIDNPLVQPLRVLPVVGRQVRSVDALAAGAADVTAISAETLAGAQALVESADGAAGNRVQTIEGLAGLARDAGRSLAAVDPGPDQALIGPLREARQEFVEDVDELRTLLGDVEVGAHGLARLFEGPHCFLLFAANNAEMRAGSGMFLQAGEICFEDGRISLGDLVSTGDLILDRSAVEIPDADLADRWGLLLPNAEFRNLALSPRFDANAELAVEMWRSATGGEVEGVLAVDPVALAAILESTGPVEVDGRRYRAGNVVEELLVEQYEDFLDDDYDADERRETLGRVAEAALDALDGGDWTPDDLLDELPEAAAGRHLLAWARDDAMQQAFEALGIAGTLQADSIAVNVLNRGGGAGGGKLDPELEVDVEWSVEDGADGMQEATLEIELHNTVEEGTPTYTERVGDPDVRYGVYEGILAVNVPGVAQGTRIEGEEGLYVVGADGPTRVVAARFELAAEQRRTFTVRFELPPRTSRVTVEPSARQPPIRWRTPTGSFDDVSEKGIFWYR